ncbi:hypothetical protein [Chromobacterium sp. IIBBL 290-4]|uniref:hypothetical protein n=1 Tax=Chromobacterium sp. IIBBL 290-4 TaxID=2953890 RepID=UPI0020B7BA71|nr:hypothetical protein [Chromobacterium sp. IIBBL 290-4]UTH75824.1 hypothetical protein NKT35_06905 [Chromobacterium sp. IIBBL 290-4]
MTKSAASRLLLLCALLCSGPAQAQTDPVLLTVSGKIRRFTDPAQRVYAFRESDLRKLPQHAIATATNWTPLSTFSGPLVRDVLSVVGAYGAKAKFYALNDYNYCIDSAEFARYDAVLAMTLNQQQLDIAHRGPLWLMYPIPDLPASMRGPTLDAKLIWQVHRLDIQ